MGSIRSAQAEVKLHPRRIRTWCALVGFILTLTLVSCTSDDAGSSTTTASDTSPSSVTPQGRFLIARLSPSGVSHHFVLEADGSGEAPFAPGKEFETRNLSPDGSRLAIVTANDQGVVVGGTIGVDGTGYRLFTDPPQGLNLACGVWGPSARMACEGWDDADPSRAGIYTVLASDGTRPARLTHGRDIPCDYSPDGSQLAFVRADADGATGTLMVMDAAGTDAHGVLDGVTIAGISCDWSPDGSSIVATSDGALVVVTPEGESRPFSAELDGYASGPVWSPDGSHVLMSMSLEGEQFDVYSAAADGSVVVRITDSDLLEEALAWMP